MKTELKPFDIWMEGYRATGNSQGAHKINDNPILADSFDEAVKKYMYDNPGHGIDIVAEDVLPRRSNYKIWGCSLFDNEVVARKSFG